MPAGRASLQMTLASQGRSASALTGALSGSGTVTLESARDRRARSACLRRRDPRQRWRPGDRRHQAAPDRRAGIVGRCVVGRVGANSVQYQGRPASRRRNHARCQGRARHRFGWLRYSRRPGRYSRHPGFDGGRSGDRPSGNSAVRRRLARCTQSHRRCCGAVVMAGGEGDRSRNPPAGFDRARRAAGGGAGVASAACGAAALGRIARHASFRSAAFRDSGSRPRSAPASAEVKSLTFRVRRQRRRTPTHRLSAQQLAPPLPPPIEIRPAPGILRQPKPRPPLVLTPPVANPAQPAF